MCFFYFSIYSIGKIHICHDLFWMLWREMCPTMGPQIWYIYFTYIFNSCSNLKYPCYFNIKTACYKHYLVSLIATSYITKQQWCNHFSVSLETVSFELLPSPKGCTFHEKLMLKTCFLPVKFVWMSFIVNWQVLNDFFMRHKQNFYRKCLEKFFIIKNTKL